MKGDKNKNDDDDDEYILWLVSLPKKILFFIVFISCYRRDFQLVTMSKSSCRLFLKRPEFLEFIQEGSLTVSCW